MILKWHGRIKNIEDLPKGELPENAVAFKEPKTPLRLNLAAALFVLPVLVFSFILLVAKEVIYDDPAFFFNPFGFLLALLMVIPHELLHAVCFPKDAEVGIYYNIKGLVAFVFSLCPVSKRRFIFLSLLPSIAFGLIPMLIWLFIPGETDFGGILFAFGFFSLTFGAGDYVNVTNALRQMPKGSFAQLSGFHSYWFMPEETEAKRAQCAVKRRRGSVNIG